MLCRAPRGLAVPVLGLSLALAVPAISWAQGPTIVCDTCSGQHHHQRAHRLCGPCAQRAEQVLAACMTCQATPPLVVPGPPPGHAVVGGPVLPAPGPGGGHLVHHPYHAPTAAPGHAVVGGPAPVAEPAPIGVMRTSFNRSGTGVPGVAPHGGGAAEAPGWARLGQPSPEMPASPQPFLAPQPPRRPRVLVSLLGLDGWRRPGEGRQRRARAAHAAIAYDSPFHPVTELPASVVYGKDKRHR